jgi:hypothetical protein
MMARHVSGTETEMQGSQSLHYVNHIILHMTILSYIFFLPALHGANKTILGHRLHIAWGNVESFASLRPPENRRGYRLVAYEGIALNSSDGLCCASLARQFPPSALASSASHSIKYHATP